MKISQREAHRLKKRVTELEFERKANNNAWRSDWFNGIHLNSIILAQENPVPREILTARKLGHAVVCAVESQKINFYAITLERISQ